MPTETEICIPPYMSVGGSGNENPLLFIVLLTETKLAYYGHTVRKQGSFLKKDNARNNARCTQAMKTTHGLWRREGVRAGPGGTCENLDSKFHMCLCAIKRSSFQNLGRKGGKFDHRPVPPKFLLHHCARPGWTTSRCGQDSPWKSQSE